MLNTTSLADPASLPLSLLRPFWMDLDPAHRIALVIGRARDQYGDDAVVAEADLREAEETCDLSVDELHRHIGEAQRIVHAPVPDPVITRASRIAKGAALVLGLMPQIGDIHSRLRLAEFTNAELSQYWDEIVARAADDFHADRGTPKPAAAMPDWGRDMLSGNAE